MTTSSVAQYSFRLACLWCTFLALGFAIGHTLPLSLWVFTALMALIQKQTIRKFASLLAPVLRSGLTGIPISGRVRRDENSAHSQQASTSSSPCIYLGRTTGTFAAHGAQHAPPGDRAVWLLSDELARHIFILGQAGSGKTTRAVYPILQQLLAAGCGALVFAIKPTEADRVEALAHTCGRSVQRAEPGKLGLNLLRGVAPDTAAAYMRDAFELTRAGGRGDPIWYESAQNRVRAALQVLASTAPRHYDLATLYRYIFVEKERNAFIAAARERLRPYRHPDGEPMEFEWAPNELRRLATALLFEDHEWAALAEDTRRSVLFTLSSLLAGFNDPELADAFCSSSMAQVDLRGILQRGEVVIVHVPADRFELASRAVYLLVKKRFQTLTSSRRADCALNQDRFVVLCADEFQRFASSADSRFMGVEARDSGTIVLAASQSIPACDEILGEKTTRAILANFSANLIFRIGDEDSRRYAASIVGHGIRDVRQGESTGHTHGTRDGSVSRSESWARVREEILDGSVFRGLRSDECVSLLWYRGRSLDDVLKVSQVTLC